MAVHCYDVDRAWSKRHQSSGTFRRFSATDGVLIVIGAHTLETGNSGLSALWRADGPEVDGRFAHSQRCPVMTRSYVGEPQFQVESARRRPFHL
jgi:hypothetical protein